MIYEYTCENCGNIELATRPVDMRDDPQVCTKCLNFMHRLIGTPGFVLKGKGFYRNDYQKPRDIKKQAIKEKNARKEGKSGYTEI